MKAKTRLHCHSAAGRDVSRPAKVTGSRTQSLAIEPNDNGQVKPLLDLRESFSRVGAASPPFWSEQ